MQKNFSDLFHSETVFRNRKMKSTAFLVFCLIVTFVEGVIILHNNRIKQNNSLANIKFDFFNDNLHDSVIDLTIETFVTLDNIRVYMKIDLSEKRNDQFDTNLVNTVMDLGKLFRGALANPIMKTVTESLLKNANFKLQLPFKPVSLVKYIILSCLQ